MPVHGKWMEAQRWTTGSETVDGEARRRTREAEISIFGYGKTRSLNAIKFEDECDGRLSEDGGWRGGGGWWNCLGVEKGTPLARLDYYVLWKTKIKMEKNKKKQEKKKK